MTNLAVVYYSGTGNVHRLAESAAAAGEKAGATVRLRRVAELVEQPPTTDRDAWAEHAAATADVPEVAHEDLSWADALMFGTPVRFGLPAPQLLAFLDSTAPLSIPGELADKVVSVFTSGSAPHGGLETTIMALHNTFCHWGAVIVSTGSTAEVLFAPSNGNPYGASNISRNQPGNVTDDNLAAAAFLAERTVGIADKLHAGAAAS